MNFKEQLKKIRPVNFVLLTIAGIINAFGVTMFLAPVKLFDSGISGTSMLLAQITPPWLSLSVFLVLLNIPLFLYGLKRQGVCFTVYSIYAIAIYSTAAWLITDVLPVDTSFVSPLAGSDLLLCALFGGLISGVGSGLTIRFGGAIDGMEVMAVIFAKKLGLSVGSFVLIYNVALYIICGLFLESWILPLYSVVAYASAIKSVDFIVEGLDRSKAAMIVTTKADEVCMALSESFGSGLTIMDAKGYYSSSRKSVIYFVVNRFQIGRMKNIVHETDGGAFITICEIADVYKANRESQ